MLKFKRMMSLMLTLALLIGMVPMTQVHAEEVDLEEAIETVQETVEVLETEAESETEISKNTIIVNEETEEAEVLETEEATDAIEEATTEEFSVIEETIPEISEEAVAATASGKFGDKLRWELDDAGILTITGTGAMAESNVPWLDHVNQIHEIVIENGVTSIAGWVFSGCANLTTVTIPESVTGIGEGAFEGCTSLADVTIPKNVSTIGNFAFHGCYSLTGIWVDSQNARFASDDSGVLYNKNMTTLISAPAGLNGSYSIPEGVTTIGDLAFFGCAHLTGITIPESVTSIGIDVFAGCNNLTSMTFPARFANGAYDFIRHESLTNITIYGEGVIGAEAFSSCENLESVTILEGVTAIDDRAFEYCSNLRTISIADTVTEIGESAFAECRNLTEIVIPEAVAEIGNGAFNGCERLTTVNIPEGITRIGDRTFYGCESLTDITIPESVTEIGKNAFGQCTGLTEVTIPEGVTTIGVSAFEGCSGLESVTLPESISSIGADVFKDCNNLTDLTVPVDFIDELFEVISRDSVTSLTIYGEGQIGDDAFAGCENLVQVTIQEGVTAIGGSAFADCSNLTDVILPDSVTHIGAAAFSGCENLKNINIPEGIDSIEELTFFGCESLTEVEIPGNVTTIGESAFEGCSGLTDLTISDGVTTIGDSAFAGCDSLTDVEIPDSVTTIGDWAFGGCTDLTTVTIPESVTEIGESAFEGCSSLRDVTLSEGVETLGDSVFAGCESLVEVIVPSSVESIGESAFAGCDNLDTIIFLGNAPEIKDNAFPQTDVTVQYMGNDPTWTEEVRNNFGDNINWEVFSCTYGHTIVIDPAVDPTCTTTGLTEGQHCDVCKQILVAQQILPIRHTAITVIPAVDPTCTETGLTEGSYCSNCDTVCVAQEVIEALGHVEVIDAAVEPNCTETGLTEGSHCDRCQEILIPQEILPINHASVTVIPGVDPTCTEDGLTEGTICEICQEILVPQEVISAHGHSFVDFYCEICGEPQESADYNLYSTKSMSLTIVNPETGKAYTSKQITWSMDEAYAPFAKIDKNGRVTAKKVVKRVRVEAVATFIGLELEPVYKTIDIFPTATALEITDADIKVNSKTLNLDYAAEPIVLTANIYPLDAVNPDNADDVTWTISDKKETYASYVIDQATRTITVTPKDYTKLGTVTIKATSVDPAKKNATVKLQFGTYATGITIDKSLTEMTVGDKAVQLNATVEPAVVSKPGVVWSLKNAADKAYVTLTSTGKITPKAVLAPVDVTVVATTKDGMVSDEYVVRIHPKSQAQLVLKSGENYITKTTQVLDVNNQESITISAHTYGEEAMTSVTWTPMTNKAANITANEDGSLTVQMIAAGSITVTAKTTDKRSATVTIKGVKQAQSLVISQKKTNISEDNVLEVASGKSLDLQATLEGAASKKVVWSIDRGDAFATVNTSGKVTATKNLTIGGQVTVRATAADGSGKTDCITIMVRPIAQGVQVYSQAGGRMLFSFRSQNMLVRSNTTLVWDLSTQEDTIAMDSHVFPYYGSTNAKNAIQKVTWKSSAPKIVEIVEDEDHNVSLKINKTGSATITVTAADGSNQKVSFKLNVVKTVTELTIADQTVKSAKSINLTKLITINPTDATNKKLTWTITSGGEYATISNGTLKAKKVTSEQIVEVTVSSQDGGASTTFRVTITP